MKLSTDTLAHDVAVRKCGQHNGILPEPRSERENEFLVNLANGYLFPLGMNDKQREGEWVWESDLSEVVYWWKNTVQTNTQNNCAYFRPDNFHLSKPSSSAAWNTIPCSESLGNVSKKMVICQKRTGKWIFINHREKNRYYLSSVVSVCVCVCMYVLRLKPHRST